MESEEVHHELDPKGDTILVLRNANAPFAVWDDPKRENVASQAAASETTQIAESSSQDETTTDPPAPQPEPPHIHFRLSSRHLILASRYFEKMMEGPWSESGTIPSFESPRIVYADDWDEQVLLILMKIVHGRSREVPRKLDLEVMAKFAVLVDYYQCLEITDIYVETWLRRLPKISGVYDRQLILRLAVSWIIPEKNALGDIAQVIVNQCTGPIRTLDLPIPQAVVGESDLAQVFCQFHVVDSDHKCHR